MNPRAVKFRGWIAALLLAMAGAPPVASAQPLPIQPELEGVTLAGAPFKLSSLRGKVVMLIYWSTDCAVCLHNMMELRTNTEGWAGKPFEVVMVSLDRSLQDVAEYQQIIAQAVPAHLRFTHLWQRAPAFRQSSEVVTGRLPETWILDKQGKLAGRHNGRLPFQVWDEIADLM